LLSSALFGGEWSVSLPSHFTSEERAPVLIGWEAGWALGHCREEKNYFTLPRIEPPAVQLITFRCTYSVFKLLLVIIIIIIKIIMQFNSIRVYLHANLTAQMPITKSARVRRKMQNN
jgi:hypothetical protein